MNSDVAAEAYGRFMGRFSEPLAEQFLAFAGIRPGDRVLDVGRGPGVDVWTGAAEDLPFADGVFDAALAQLVVQSMRDPVAGLGQLARVTRPGGIVAACVWDHGGGTGPLSLFWNVAEALDPTARDESGPAGTSEGDLVRLFGAAGLPDPVQERLTVAVEYPTFDDWWQPYTLGVGPAGDYLAGLRDADAVRLRLACADRLGPGPFTITASAWAVRAHVLSSGVAVARIVLSRDDGPTFVRLLSEAGTRFDNDLEIELADALATSPQLVDLWDTWCGDQRWTPSAAFDGTRAWWVLTNGKAVNEVVHDTPAQAAADFIHRLAVYVARREVIVPPSNDQSSPR